jgi:hexulose-6-phosphate isomerase
MVHKSITLRAFPPELSTLARVDLARAAGFHAVEINLEHGLDIHPDLPDAALTSMAQAIRERGMEISSIYSRAQWASMISSGVAANRAKGIDIVKRLIEAAHFMQIGAVLVIPGAVDDGLFGKQPELVHYDVVYQRVQEVLAELLPLAAAAGTVLAIENVPNKFLVSPLEMARFVDELNHPNLGVYFDVANAMLYGFPEQWIPILGRRIRRVHVKDYRLDVGGLRGFCGMLQGDINWPLVAQELRQVGYDGYVTSEVLPAYRYHGERLIYEASAAITAVFD